MVNSKTDYGNTLLVRHAVRLDKYSPDTGAASYDPKAIAEALRWAADMMEEMGKPITKLPQLNVRSEDDYTGVRGVGIFYECEWDGSSPHGK